MPSLTKIRADDRRHDAGAADGERIKHQDREVWLTGKEDGGENHRRHDGDGIGFKKVRRHAGAVADVVADVVGNRCRIARIVFGYAGFDLADKIATDVGALREDAAAETGEDRNQRGAETERDERVDDVAATGLQAKVPCEEGVVGGDAEKRQTGDQHAGNRTGLEGDVETLAERHRRSLSRPHVGAHRHVHADVAGEARQARADQEAGGLHRTEKKPGENEDYNPDDRDRAVLPVEVGLRAFTHRSRDFLHSGVALVGAQHDPGRKKRIEDRQRPAGDDPPKYVAH